MEDANGLSASLCASTPPAFEMGTSAEGGPPDVTHLDRAERLEVLRDYRRMTERQRTFDFTRGPPDVAGLEGAERLSVLRSYRQYQQERDGAFGAHGSSEVSAAVIQPAGMMCIKRDDATVPTRPASLAPWLQPPEPPIGSKSEPLDVSDLAGAIGEAHAGADQLSWSPGGSAAAGVASGAHGSVHTYFERPLTARDSSRVPPTIESDPAATSQLESAQLAAQRADLEAQSRAEALDGAAGRQSASASTAWQGSWLDAETPRNCRRLLRKEGEYEATSHRIFAPEMESDEAGAEEARQKAKALLLARQVGQPLYSLLRSPALRYACVAQHPS